MHEQPYTKRLREMLHNMFGEAKDVSNNREVNINCPLCRLEGDEDKGHHMYISLGYDNKPPMFNCFRRTSHSGLLTKSALEHFNCNIQYLDSQLMEEIEKSIKIISNYGSFRLIRSDKIQLNVPLSTNEQKIQYINNRLGLSLSYGDMIHNKIVLNLYDFLRYNNIRELTKDHYICDMLDKYFVGFLANNNMSILMRNTIDKNSGIMHNMRYYKYDVVNNPLENYYIIPCTCDIYKPIDIIIAEGPFDILSVFYNLYHGDRENKVFGAVGSKAYKNLIKYFYISYGLLNVRLHIYIDSGVEKRILDDIKRVISPLCSEIYIHVNMYHGEKDYGVPLKKIKDYCYRL